MKLPFTLRTQLESDDLSTMVSESSDESTNEPEMTIDVPLADDNHDEEAKEDDDKRAKDSHALAHGDPLSSTSTLSAHACPTKHQKG